MAVDRTRGATGQGHLTERPFRPAWSLAAGWSAAPRVDWFAAVVAIAALAEQPRWSEPTEDGSPVYAHRPGRGTLLVALLAWAVWSLFAPACWRRIGERRRILRDGRMWWRDRDWPARGSVHRIATGMQGTSVSFACSLAVTGALILWCWRLVVSASEGRYGELDLYGWTHTGAGATVAVYVLPLAWTLLILWPRLGRGRLLVSWPTFPQFTGTRCAFHVGTSPGGARIDGVRVFLRCIRVRHRPLLPLSTWNARLAWVAEARVPLGTHVGPESHVRAEFDVPTDAPSTNLHADDTVRWELLVLGTVGAADYADSVDVPVYASTV